MKITISITPDNNIETLVNIKGKPNPCSPEVSLLLDYVQMILEHPNLIQCWKCGDISTSGHIADGLCGECTKPI